MKISLFTLALACSALLFSCQKEVTGPEVVTDPPPTLPVIEDSSQLYKFALVDISTSDTTDYTIFGYDNSGRIIKSTSYLGWPNPADSFITQYHYANAADTVMSGYVQYSDGDTTKVFLQYDNQGRLVKDSLVNLPDGFPAITYTSRYVFSPANIIRTTVLYLNLTQPQHIDTTYSFQVFSNGNLVQQRDSSSAFVSTVLFTYDTNPNRWIKGFPRVPVWSIGTHDELGLLNGTGKNNLIKTETTDVYPTTTLHRIYSYRNRSYNSKNFITRVDGFGIDNSSPEQALQRELYYYR